MKKTIATIIVILACAGAAFADDPIEGFWLSVDPKSGQIQSGWEMYIINGTMYGRMVSAIGCTPTTNAKKCKDSYANFPIPGIVNQLPILGTPWMFNLKMENPGRWTKGNIVNPEDGKMYGLSLIHHPADGGKFKQETLEVQGRLAIFSGSQYWRRGTQAEASALK
jgi:uncharacterized protein (DUF2147 family)